MGSRSRSVSSRSLPRYNRLLPDWVPAQKRHHATSAENCPGPATQKGSLTARKELSRHRVGPASPGNPDTRQQCWVLPCEHTSAGLCIGAAGAAGAAAADARDTGSASYSSDGTYGGPRSRQATHLLLQYKSGDVVRRHWWRTRTDSVTGYTMAALMEDLRRRAAAPVKDREPADIGGARGRSHGPAAERPGLGHGKHRVGRAAIQDVLLREF